MDKIISKILNNQAMPVKERVRLTREWLQSGYRLKDVKDERFLQLLTDVHDHDGLDLHFGEVPVGTSFDAGFVRLVAVAEGWHLAFSRKPEEGFAIIHPTREQAGVTPENLKVLKTVQTLVKSGSVPAGAVPGSSSVPVGEWGSGLVMSSPGLEEPVVDEGTLKPSPAIVESVTPVSTTSVTINMDDYLK